MQPPPSTPERLSIRELVAATGVSRRTVRYYVEIGLLPKPRGAGRGHYYTRDHLERLLRIKDLRDRRYSIAEIRAALGRPGPEAATRETARDELHVSAALAPPEAFETDDDADFDETEDTDDERPAAAVAVPPIALHSRIRVAPGVEVVVEHGARAPTLSELRALALAARRILGRDAPDD